MGTLDQSTNSVKGWLAKSVLPAKLTDKTIVGIAEQLRRHAMASVKNAKSNLAAVVSEGQNRHAAKAARKAGHRRPHRGFGGPGLLRNEHAVQKDVREEDREEQMMKKQKRLNNLAAK